ncbi:MAG: hypothetical protein FD149_2345 [Rhodospirillaceae bacterium]|nr:MAG: hypothetical protein FD149_2345 [Rhodospirillaceae bacterium]
MTATEVLERASEMARILGATYGRLQSELLTPLIVRAVSILRRRGDIPDVRVDGRVVGLQYRAPLAQAQAHREAQNALMWLGALGGLGPLAMATVDVSGPRPPLAWAGVRRARGADPRARSGGRGSDPEPAPGDAGKRMIPLRLQPVLVLLPSLLLFSLISNSSQIRRFLMSDTANLLAFTSHAVATGGLPNRPSHVPERFWDTQNNTLHAESLLQAYLDLERRLGSVPENPDGYTVRFKHKMMTADSDVNKILHGARFTNDQAQIVYDLATEKVLPLLADLASQFEAERHLARLVDHFGGEEKWAEIARQLMAWGQANLPPDMLAALSTTAEGVKTLYRMMASGEPGLTRSTGTGVDVTTEKTLKKMMEDPRYWRDRDPAFIGKVADGFKRLYPGQYDKS